MVREGERAGAAAPRAVLVSTSPLLWSRARQVIAKPAATAASRTRRSPAQIPLHLTSGHSL